MMRLYIFPFFILLMSLTGCAIKIPPVSTYVFSAPTVITAHQAPRSFAVLLVSEMKANPGYKTSHMLYMKSPAHLSEFSRNAWVAPPAQMFTSVLIERMQSQNYFRAVATPPFSGNSDYRLDSRLLVLHQDFLQPVSRVFCAVEVLLINNRSGRVVASRNFQAVISAPGNNPASGAAAANQAVRQLSDEITVFLVAHVRKK